MQVDTARPVGRQAAGLNTQHTSGDNFMLLSCAFGSSGSLAGIHQLVQLYQALSRWRLRAKQLVYLHVWQCYSYPAL